MLWKSYLEKLRASACNENLNPHPDNGNVAVEDILSDPTFKEGMTNSQLYRWNQVI